jgi:hypothetical protein
MIAGIVRGGRIDMAEKRRFPRFPVKKQVVCFRYGKEMVMRTLDISLGGLKLEAPFDLGVGESMDFAILADGSKIRGKGRIRFTPGCVSTIPRIWIFGDYPIVFLPLLGGSPKEG